ncbi:hypothetical protein ACFVL4_21235 [Bacillus subtilis]|uniref:hypothetical protein n=1 Tax=Bacillus subtilis TaxID=1423 RepID=UPI00254AC855|nr:hypothetical protein [Bacillus subtilis]MDK7657012.1 hypothetical protein [Bacillus subtilis]
MVTDTDIINVLRNKLFTTPFIQEIVNDKGTVRGLRKSYNSHIEDCEADNKKPQDIVNYVGNEVQRLFREYERCMEELNKLKRKNGLK